MMHSRMCWFFIYEIVAYEFNCPEKLHRQLRVKTVCDENYLGNYSCLLDQHSNVYKESCRQPADFVRPGQKYVIGVFRKNTECDILRYQPFKFWSHRLSQCVFAKAYCNEAGQIISTLGSTEIDSVCRCDHTKGYAFVNNPKDQCYCMPSKEDCTCYKKTCSLNNSLTSDYKCKSTLTTKSPCQDVKSIINTTERNSSLPDVKDMEYSTITKVNRSMKIPLLISMFLLVSLSLIFAFVIFEQPAVLFERRNDKTDLHLKKSDKDSPLRPEEWAQGKMNTHLESRIRYYNSDEERKDDLIVAVEIGLTFSGMMIYFPENRATTKPFCPVWNSAKEGKVHNKTSTSILLGSNGIVDSIGYDADFLYDQKNESKMKDWLYFKHFILALCKEELTKECVLREYDDKQNKKETNAVDVIAAFIKNVKDKLATVLQERELVHMLDNTRWLLTAPAIWNENGKQMMSNAVVMAGISKDNFILLEEPKAVFVYYKSTTNMQAQSYRCIVLQVEEKAINATVMEVNSTTCKVTYTVFSQCGDVSHEANRFLICLFNSEVTDFCKSKHPQQYNELFQEAKKKINNVHRTKKVRIRIPPVWCTVYKNITGIEYREHLKDSTLCFSRDKLEINKDFLSKFNDDFVHGRIQVVSELLAKESTLGIHVLFLAGDSVDRIFLDTLQKKYPKHNIQVAEDPKTVIMRGALKYWSDFI